MNISRLIGISSVMRFQHDQNIAIRYRGFLLLQQPNQTWLVRPERSPMILLPFRTTKCSLAEAKKILLKKLTHETEASQAA